MAEASKGTRSGRLQLLLVVVVFGGPLLVAAWLYYGGTGWRPQGTTNHGVLLEPISNVREAATDPDAFEQINEGHWLLLYADPGECDQRCREALYTIRQLRLMLGNDMTRVTRVFLHGPVPPDRVFLDEQHPGLITTTDPGVAKLLAARAPDGPGGGYFLIDPLGNLVMYFAPELDPGDVIEDVERLLRLSRIG